MPNHVSNILKMEGIASLPIFGEEKNRITGEMEKFLDFGKIIPMAESLNIESGSCTDEAIVYYATDRCTLPIRAVPEEQQMLLGKVRNLFAGSEWVEEVFKRVLEKTHGMPAEKKEELYKKGETYAFNIKNYGHATWYDWCVANWGTKWNAYGCVVEEDQVTFQTAWSNPEPVITKLAEMYPEAHIEHTWADEDMGSNTGYREYIDGQWYGGYDDTDQEAYEHYIECWGETNCLYKDEDGNWQRRSCEECDGCD